MWPFDLPIDWRALATFLAGSLAVGAAVWVARQQIQLRRYETRLDLFDKRRAVLRGFDKVAAEWWTTARLSPETFDEFREMTREVELLYDQPVFEEISQIFDDTMFQSMFDRHARMYSEAGMESDRIRAIEESMARFRQVLDRLPKVRAVLVRATRVGTIFND